MSALLYRLRFTLQHSESTLEIRNALNDAFEHIIVLEAQLESAARERAQPPNVNRVMDLLEQIANNTSNTVSQLDTLIDWEKYS
jgi:hypothetical protein